VVRYAGRNGSPGVCVQLLVSVMCMLVYLLVWMICGGENVWVSVVCCVFVVLIVVAFTAIALNKKIHIMAIVRCLFIWFPRICISLVLVYNNNAIFTVFVVSEGNSFLSVFFDYVYVEG